MCVRALSRAWAGLRAPLDHTLHRRAAVIAHLRLPSPLERHRPDLGAAPAHPGARGQEARADLLEQGQVLCRHRLNLLVRPLQPHRLLRDGPVPRVRRRRLLPQWHRYARKGLQPWTKPCSDWSSVRARLLGQNSPPSEPTAHSSSSPRRRSASSAPLPPSSCGRACSACSRAAPPLGRTC